MWCAVQVGERVYRQTIVAPSQAELERRAAEAAAPRPRSRNPARALALVVRELRGGPAAPAEAHAIVDALTTEDTVR